MTDTTFYCHQLKTGEEKNSAIIQPNQNISTLQEIILDNKTNIKPQLNDNKIFKKNISINKENNGVSTKKALLQKSFTNSDLNHIGDLGEINSNYTIDSPSLRKVIFENERYKHFKELSYFMKTCNVPNPSFPSKTEYFNYLPHCVNENNEFRSFDKKETYLQENSEHIVTCMLQDFLNNRRPIFPRELEFQELYSSLTFKDKVLHFLFGRDKNGFFRLEKLKDFFENSLIFPYKCEPYFENENESYFEDSITYSDIYLSDNELIPTAEETEIEMEYL
ncbi:hypothetical protein TPHA_0B03270 [Tetrapisispora phaffii CBS 4417]|uniref:Uncharacterized protein n=1 Tax=Tetrapisispora phaffii (strain ATCC 24235 / CBS 4417 / NBRC 1672 / NRRL Y-8282 / UCD 70-5) TaxID=1071381 RepID=G8BPR8_TETPH|nr:hypothetical protein TPHA_0B03270 [Tetrapisispora phaffii CBS 4417]CCE61999.1 hypothetical protein TPHA_0B03270 [Tetrapisispora phaffii CBS 4417]